MTNENDTPPASSGSPPGQAETSGTPAPSAAESRPATATTSVEPVKGDVDLPFPLQEDEEVYVHPRDPYSRVDTLHSSPHVQVAIDGVVLADSVKPVLLFETGLPARYYLPQVDVRMDLLVPTETATACPYKGTARYWSYHAGSTAAKDVAWSYPTPLAESLKVAGLVAFYNERVDLTIDGVPQERPRTPFS